jgi:hypothetical protein
MFLISGFVGWIVQSDQFSRRIILFGERVFGIGVHDLQHVAGTFRTQSQVLIVHGDNPVSIFEYRSLIHTWLDARFHSDDAMRLPKNDNARLLAGRFVRYRTDTLA